MEIKDRIPISTLGGDKVKVKLFEEDNREAVLTHYLQNDNIENNELREEAVEYTKHLLKEIYPKKEITKEVAEAALQYDLFDFSDIPFMPPQNPNFTFIDLFAGIGGFRIAMQNIQGKCVYSSEWDQFAQLTYRRNFGETPFGDITKDRTKSYIPPNFDILCAGFPCQPFSIAGNRQGFSDTRGTLFFDIEEIASKHRPRVLFLENVKNLVSHDKGKTFKVIVEIIEEKLGYRVFHRVLNSMTHANVPQNRERIFIVAFDPNQVENYRDFKWPKRIELTKTIHDVLESQKQEDKYYYPESHPYYQELNENMTKRDTVYQWRRVYVRENKSNVCPTLTANMGTGGHNVPLIRDDYGIRKLTPKECFAFQGFPVDKYVLPELSNGRLYMQAGNSVTVDLIERISKEILKVL